ncbi:hypothetical protein AAVH_17843 [Aphelenchoides avenae]|nr:hypothetical protein AAVH_17843 [Aphelenchus avenae]
MGDLQEKINVLERDLQSEMDARASADQTAADLMAIVATLQEDLAYARNELKKIPKAIDHDREVSNLSAFNVPDPEAELAIVLKKAQTNEAVERENARLGRRLEEMRSTALRRMDEAKEMRSLLDQARAKVIAPKTVKDFVKKSVLDENEQLRKDQERSLNQIDAMTAKIDSLEKAFDSAMVKLRFYNSLGPAKALSARRPDGEMTSVEKELLSANARLTAKLKMAELDLKPYREHAKRVTEAAKSAFHDLEQSTLQNVELKAIVDDWSKKLEKSATDAESKQSLIDRLQKALEKERSAARRDDKAVADIRKQNDELVREVERLRALYEDLSDRAAIEKRKHEATIERLRQGNAGEGTSKP